MAIDAVIFDYKAVMSAADEDMNRLMDLLEWLAVNHILYVVFSTDAISHDRLTRDGLLPHPDLLVTAADIPSGKRRGSPAWIDVVTDELAAVPHSLFYVGATALDWRTAINAGVFYLHAGWYSSLPAGTRSLVANTPRDVMWFLEMLLVPQFPCAYGADLTDGTSIRSLLPAGVQLGADDDARPFTLQDVFTYKRQIKIGGNSAQSVLMLQLLCRLYVDGALTPGAWFCIYPGSQPGVASGPIQEYLIPAASLVHGFYKPDLLIRHTAAIDTSLERVAARREGRSARANMTTQANTVQINPEYEGKVSGRHVLVFDDFTTTGMSLEWARLLLKAAGADRVTLVTVGKYSTSYRIYSLDPDIDLDPFSACELELEDFAYEFAAVEVDPEASSQVQAVVTSLTEKS